MAVELGLNCYAATHPNETTLQKLERRNRERTYLVLFVHDRSLSTQTGRHWMLPENDDLIQNSGTWHRHGVDDKVRPEDVIVAAFVELRRIAVCQFLVSIRDESHVIYHRLKQPMFSVRQRELEPTTSTMKSYCATVMPS